LILFKPNIYHNNKNLLDGYDTYEQSYKSFINKEENKIYANAAILQESFIANYYQSDHQDAVDNNQQTAETLIMNSHPFDDELNDPHYQPNNMEQTFLQLEELQDALRDDGVDETELLSMLQTENDTRAQLQCFVPLQEGFNFNAEIYPNIAKPSELSIPLFRGTHVDYVSKLIDPRVANDKENVGTQLFIGNIEVNDVKIKMLKEYYEPIPWIDPSHSGIIGPPDITRLPQFCSIRQISQAMRLDFWQHYNFETVARHLLYEWVVRDIAKADKSLNEIEFQRPIHIKKSLIHFMFGNAGTGKSAVINSILLLARLWGRRDSVETMACTGVAGLQIDGETIHSSRNINMFSNESRYSTEVRNLIKRVYLSIVDEVSMAGQPLIGAADVTTRTVLDKPKEVWGGMHLMVVGDYGQLPPVLASPIFQPITDKTKHSYTQSLAAFELWTNINSCAPLIDNWRQRDDEPYRKILDRMRYGVLRETDIDLLNTRYIGNIDKADYENIYGDQNHFEYWSPLLVSTNEPRCIYNREMVFAVAKKLKVPVYEILATTHNQENQRKIDAFQYKLTEQETDKIPLLFQFHLMCMPVMNTKRCDKESGLDKLRLLANGLIAFIIGYIKTTNGRTIRIIMSEDDPYPEDFVSQVRPDGIVIKRFKKVPDYLLMKVRNCNRVLVEGFPEGVFQLPIMTNDVKFKLPGTKTVISFKIKQFPLIANYAMTPEKSQGSTVDGEVTIGKLNCEKSQALYVAFSRVRALKQIILTEKLTLQYVRKFLPSKALLNELKRQVMAIDVPDYIPHTEQAKFFYWKENELQYYNEAIAFHEEKDSRKKKRHIVKDRSTIV
jgi:hypothetical protein